MSFASLLLIDFTAPRDAPLGPSPAERPPRRRAGGPLAALGRAMARFFAIFGRLGATLKNDDFSNRPKTAQNALTIDIGTSRAPFWAQKHDFWGPFWHRFFDFFAKSENHENAIKTNCFLMILAFQGVSFSTYFSLNFQAFSRTPPEGCFGRPKVPT